MKQHQLSAVKDFADAADAADSEQPAVRARVPLTVRGGVMAEIVSFTLPETQDEHVALLFSGWERQDEPLVRLHSGCLTGDVFGSARCDCGDQLGEAMDALAEQGGVLLYLQQEGRGIGLYNKLDAYKLQIEQGLDTYAANRALGFADDLRDYKPAAQMLSALGIRQIRLLSGNPDKAAQLEKYGVTVRDIVPMERHETAENAPYLSAKENAGHTFRP